MLYWPVKARRLTDALPVIGNAGCPLPDAIVQVVGTTDTEADVVVGLELSTAVKVESVAEEESEVGIELPGTGAPVARPAVAGIVGLGHRGATTAGQNRQ